MGWNSYDNFGDAVTEAETLANAEWMKEHLQPFGWDTVVVDFRWYDRSRTGDNRVTKSATVRRWRRMNLAGCCPRPTVFPPPRTAPASSRSPTKFMPWV